MASPEALRWDLPEVFEEQREGASVTKQSEPRRESGR